jgi:hypothetical protein
MAADRDEKEFSESPSPGAQNAPTSPDNGRGIEEPGMSEREKQLRRALDKAQRALIEALEWCPDESGAKDDLRLAARKLDGVRAWFVQTHA